MAPTLELPDQWHALPALDVAGRLGADLEGGLSAEEANLVAADPASECELMLSYAIGEPRPTTVFARTFGSGLLPDERLRQIVADLFVWDQQLSRRSYQRLAASGHFGRTDLDPLGEAGRRG